MDRAQNIDEQLAALAAHLAARREAILQAWRKAVDRDPEMTTGASLPRTQLNDHIPDLLDAFGRTLIRATGEQRATYEDEHKGDAAAHGLQRWQQGYDLREVTREWGRLQLCLVDELESYAVAHRDIDPGVMSLARRAWAEMCGEGVRESTAKYFQLQQIEAMGHVRDLEKALEQVRELERQRADLWRQAAHDLRGNLGVVSNVTAGLSLQGVPEPLRDNFLRMLKKNVSSLHSMLDDVMDLARLQAGHEQRLVKPFDAATVLQEFCERMQPLAEERGLFLKTEGPATLLVEGDAVKMQRITQNLLLNALKYTPQGGVTVSWFTVRNAGADAGGVRFSIFAAGPSPGPMTYTISENAIAGSGDASDDLDYGFYTQNAYDTLVFTKNQISQTGSNAIVLERHYGASDVSDNTFDRGVSDFSVDAYFNMNYGGPDITTLQQVSHNKIDMGTGTLFTNDQRGFAITFAGAFTGADGRFTDVEVDHNEIMNLKPYRRGIGFWNNGTADGGDITGVITDNKITGATGDVIGTIGVRLLGLINDALIDNNDLKKLETGMQLRDWGSGNATDALITDNNITEVALGLELLAGASGNVVGDNKIYASGPWTVTMSAGTPSCSTI